MNKKQKTIVICVIVAIAWMLLFPPFYYQGPEGFSPNCGYYVIGAHDNDLADGKCRVDSVTLFTQWAGVLIVGALAFFVAKGKRE
jgi:hypothetical protein